MGVYLYQLPVDEHSGVYKNAAKSRTHAFHWYLIGIISDISPAPFKCWKVDYNTSYTMERDTSFCNRDVFLVLVSGIISEGKHALPSIDTLR